MTIRFAKSMVLGTAAAMGLMVSSASASLIFYDGFDYPGLPTPLNGKSDWTSHSGTEDELQVVAGSLGFSGLQSPTGGKVELLEAQTEDVGRNFAAVTGDGNTVYASVLLNCTKAPVFGTTGDYLLHFYQGDLPTGGSNFNFRARLYISSADASETGILFGIRPTSGSPDPSEFGSTVYDLNTTHLVVLKVTLSDGDEQFDVFVNPVPGSPEPATAEYSVADDVIDPAIGVGRFALRQGSTSAGSFEIDELRVGTTWESVTPTATASTVDTWHLYE